MCSAQSTMAGPKRVLDKDSSRSLPWQGHRVEGSRSLDGGPSKIIPNLGEAAFPFPKAIFST